MDNEPQVQLFQELKRKFNMFYLSILRSMKIFIFLILLQGIVPILAGNRLFDGREFFQALVKTYPDRVNSMAFRKGDWSIRINGKLFYWAEGKILPEDALDKADMYSPYQVYRYPKSMPRIADISSERKKQLQKRIQQQEAFKDLRHPAYMIALWGMPNENTAEKNILYTMFLNRKIRIHPNIQQPLKRVETQILKLAKTDADLQRWIDTIYRTDAFVWRRISKSANRSLHSYGIAIDILHRSYNGKEVYWQWAASHYQEWWLIPYSKRYFPPWNVIDIFEKNGFLWGGKWFFFDQIHFEYRPEIILLNRL